MDRTDARPRFGNTSSKGGTHRRFGWAKSVVFGGGDGYVLNDLFCFEVDTFLWTKINCTAPGRCAHSSLHVDGKLFIYGGGNGARCFKDMYIFDAEQYLKMEEAKQAKLKNRMKVKQKLELLLEQKFHKQSHNVPDRVEDHHLNSHAYPNSHSNGPHPHSPSNSPTTSNNYREETELRRREDPRRPREIELWLKGLNFSQYSEHFLQQEIDMDVVHLLTEEHLKKMGIDRIGVRLSLCVAIDELRKRRERSQHDHAAELKDLKQKHSKILTALSSVSQNVNAISEGTLALANSLSKNGNGTPRDDLSNPFLR
eukprot:TRINITY_DN9285_c5_g1_i1.p1 TRINITY_DN9285_c5_g1~~TRINITY_DN9285_c5_g1_i1.p1  ORF type:complete len:312 (-),score=69.69 TRINITY_DN9285_c5_g1_i1:37-972(-)